MEITVPKDFTVDQQIEPYQSGYADRYTNPSGEGLSIELGDTCNVVGGKAFILDEPNGQRLIAAWPDVYGTTGFASLPEDTDILKERSGITSRELVMSPYENNKLYLEQYDNTLAQDYGFEVDIEEGKIISKSSEYRAVKREDYRAMYEIMSKVFHYDGPPESMLNILTATGGHVAGIYWNKELAGFTTIAYATHPKLGNSLFVDMIGVDPKFQGKHLGRFGLQACALAATALGLSKVRLTYDGENTKLANFYLSSGVQPREYLYSVYGKGISRFLAELDLADPIQRQRSIYGKASPSIPAGVPKVLMAPNDYVFQTDSYQLLSGDDRLVIADYDDQHGYIGYYYDTRT